MNNPALLPISLIVFVDILGFTIVIPLLPFYAESFGASPFTVGLLLSLYALCALVAAPLLGRWSDRWGRKPVLLISQFGSLIGFVGLALAPSLTWLFVARAIDGFTAGNVATARAYISDVTAPKDRSAAFGLIAAAFSFGFLVGPASAALLATLGHAAPFWAAAVVSLCSILCTWRLLPASTPVAPATSDDAGQSLLQIPGVPSGLLQMFGFLAAFSMFTAGFALFCERRLSWHGAPFGPTEVGLVLAFVGLLGLLTQLFLLRVLIARWGESRMVQWGMLGGILSYTGLSQTHALLPLLVFLGIVAVANAALRPAMLGLLSQKVPAHRQGALFGLTQSMQSLAMILGPLLAGALIHANQLGAWALACAGVLLLALTVPRLLLARRAAVMN